MPGGYGIYYGDSMATDFVYDACGSQISGLLAVEQDGKWGYVDKQGNVVIPIEYDASWTQYVPQYRTVDTEPQDFCYAASEGTCSPGKRRRSGRCVTAGGDLVIAPGVFEEIRPVHEGKCWVKYEGKWGVIELTDEEDAEIETEDEEKEESELSAESSVEEITEAIAEHLNESLGEDEGSYSISESEMQEDGHRLLVPGTVCTAPGGSGQDYAAGGMPSANRHVGEVTVDLATGTAVWEPIMGRTRRMAALVKES